MIETEPHHGVSVVVGGDALIVSDPSVDRDISTLPSGVTIRRLEDGETLQTINDGDDPQASCWGMHGKAVVGSTVMFGCHESLDGGVLVVEPDPATGGFSAEEVDDAPNLGDSAGSARQRCIEQLTEAPIRIELMRVECDEGDRLRAKLWIGAEPVLVAIGVIGGSSLEIEGDVAAVATLVEAGLSSAREPLTVDGEGAPTVRLALVGEEAVELELGIPGGLRWSVCPVAPRGLAGTGRRHGERLVLAARRRGA